MLQVKRESTGLVQEYFARKLKQAYRLSVIVTIQDLNFNYLYAFSFWDDFLPFYKPPLIRLQ